MVKLSSKCSQFYFRHSIKRFPVSEFYGTVFYFKPSGYCKICKETHSNRDELIEKQSTHLRLCLQSCKIRFFSQLYSLYLAIFRRMIKVPIPSIKYWKQSQKLGLTSTLNCVSRCNCSSSSYHFKMNCLYNNVKYVQPDWYWYKMNY